MSIRVILFPVKLVIGLICLIVSIPLIVLAMPLILAGEENAFDWWMDHLPYSLWLGFLERN